MFIKYASLQQPPMELPQSLFVVNKPSHYSGVASGSFSYLFFYTHSIKAEESHNTECVFTCRPHAHKLSTKSELSFLYHTLLYPRKLQAHYTRKPLHVFFWIPCTSKLYLTSLLKDSRIMSSNYMLYCFSFLFAHFTYCNVCRFKPTDGPYILFLLMFGIFVVNICTNQNQWVYYMKRTCVGM